MQLQLQLRYATLHPADVVRWPLQPLQPVEKTQLQPPVGPSVDSLCHPWFTTTNLSYSFPIFETSATALRGTTVMICFNRKRWEASPWMFEPTETEEWKLYQVKLTDQLAPMLMKIKQLAGEIARRRCLLCLRRHGEAKKCLYWPSSRFQTERFGDGSHCEFEAEWTWAESLNKGSADFFCQILQKRGLAVDASDNHHQTRLFAAARESNENCADWLIAQGCAVDHADFRGETPLFIAFQNSQMEMVMKLLKHAVSLGVKDMYGGSIHVFHTQRKVVSQHFLPTLFLEKPLRRSAENPMRPWVRQRSENMRKRGQAEEDSLWKRFRGDLSLRCTGPNVMTQWAYQDQVVPDETIPLEQSHLERPHLDFFGSHW